jgi:hypothetical protein
MSSFPLCADCGTPTRFPSHWSLGPNLWLLLCATCWAKRDLEIDQRNAVLLARTTVQLWAAILAGEPEHAEPPISIIRPRKRGAA